VPDTADEPGSCEDMPGAQARKVSSMLESIARRYPEGSEEYRAIEEAARAFVFLNEHKMLGAAYDKYRRAAGKPLTVAQQDALRSMGIEPD
jgi:hypothetical protein